MSEHEEKMRKDREMATYVASFRKAHAHILNDPEFKKSVQIAENVLNNAGRIAREARDAERR